MAGGFCLRGALVQLRNRVALALNVNGAKVRNNGGGGFGLREALVQLRHRVALALKVNGVKVRNSGGGGVWFAGSVGSASEIGRFWLQT